MTTLEIILTQIAISLAVVILYHLWFSRTKQPSPLASDGRGERQGEMTGLSAAQSAIRNPQSAIAEGQGQVRDSSAAQSAIRNPQSAIESTPPEIIAAIAAAITVVLGPHRVVAIQQIAAPVPDVNVWALEGRMKHFMSHKVR